MVLETMAFPVTAFGVQVSGERSMSLSIMKIRFRFRR
jgi:hypothetical protein